MCFFAGYRKEGIDQFSHLCVVLLSTVQMKLAFPPNLTWLQIVETVGIPLELNEWSSGLNCSNVTLSFISALSQLTSVPYPMLGKVIYRGHSVLNPWSNSCICIDSTRCEAEIRCQVNLHHR